MTARILMTTAFAALAAFPFTPALADVTADEVWQNWKDLGTAYSQSYSAGSEVRSGDSLTITDLSMELSADDGNVSGLISKVIFRETGDGRVEITMSNESLLTMQSKNENGKALSNTINIDQDGLTMIASGTPDAISYDIAVDSVVVTVLDFMIDGQPREMEMDLELSGLAAMYQVSPGEMTFSTSTFAAKAISFQAIGQDEEGTGEFELMGQMNNVAGASSGAAPKDMAEDDFVAALAQGFTADGSFTYDSGNLTVMGQDPEGATTNFDSSSNGGSLNFSFDKDRIAYGLRSKGVQMKVSGSAIPFPELAATYDEAALNLLLPLAQSDEAKDFALETRLQGLTVSDLLWGMIDPAASLPRDPATLVVSLSGKAKVLVDLLSESQETLMGEAPPFAVEALNIDALQLTVAGAEFKGDGALAFDNMQPPVLGGMAPMPTGKLNLSLTGANTLLGKLQALGLVDPQITMTFGMMAGMLAKPGPTPDSLISEVEIKEGGQILSNGNPLPF